KAFGHDRSYYFIIPVNRYNIFSIYGKLRQKMSPPDKILIVWKSMEKTGRGNRYYYDNIIFNNTLYFRNIHLFLA
ncbi:hypothetical protein JW964_22870, partial [candidate division KSB1 bacterium]|nr:hypothetical protein [candidate division KSB1 bacterium]